MTGAILAGGKASRFDGELKSHIKLNGARIIDTQIMLFKKLFDEVIIVTNDCAPYLDHDAFIVNDIIKDKGPLGGIYTALYHMSSDKCFVAACDMPFLNESLIRQMMENIGRDWIYTIKTHSLDGTSRCAGHGGRWKYEPLHTIYDKKCIKAVKRMLMNDNLKVSPLFDELRAKVMPVDEAMSIDPEFRSLKNMNTKEDLMGCAGLTG